MALTTYVVHAASGIQLPNGRVARDGSKVQLESTDTRVVALVAAGTLSVTANLSELSPPLLAGTVFTGRAKPPELRPAASEGVHNISDPEDVKTHINPQMFTDLIAK